MTIEKTGSDDGALYLLYKTSPDKKTVILQRLVEELGYETALEVMQATLDVDGQVSAEFDLERRIRNGLPFGKP